MGTNYHTPIAGTTKWKTTDVNPIFASLDQALTFLKNVIVHCSKDIKYDENTGVLTWTGNLNIIFPRSDGTNIRNYISASNVTLADGQFCYVDLNETNDTALTMQVASATPGTLSNLKTYNRLVLAYRNSTSDKLFSVHLSPYWENIVHRSVTTSDATETTLISKTLTEGSAYLFNAYVVGRLGDTKRVAYIRRALVYRPAGGSATLEGTVPAFQADLTKESDAAYDCTIDVNGNNARIRVTGEGVWEGKLEITSV